MSKKSKTFRLKATAKDLQLLSDGEVPNTLVMQAKKKTLKKKKGATKKQLKKALCKFIHKDDIGTTVDVHEFLDKVHHRLSAALTTHRENMIRLSKAS